MSGGFSYLTTFGESVILNFVPKIFSNQGETMEKYYVSKKGKLFAGTAIPKGEYKEISLEKFCEIAESRRENCWYN